MTLIEMMIVIALIGLAASGVSYGFNALTRANLRSACSRVAGAVRFGYDRAVIQGKTVRLTFEIPGNTLALEETERDVTLAASEDPRRGEEGEGAGAAAVDPWASAQQRMQEAFEPSFGASPFGPLTNTRGQVLEKYKKIELDDDVKIVRLIAPHEPDPKESGQGALYFFPGGRTEHAVVQLSDGSDDVYSIEIHPLTGRPKVHNEAYRPETLLDDPANERATGEIEE